MYAVVQDAEDIRKGLYTSVFQSLESDADKSAEEKDTRDNHVVTTKQWRANLATSASHKIFATSRARVIGRVIGRSPAPL